MKIGSNLKLQQFQARQAQKQQRDSKVEQLKKNNKEPEKDKLKQLTQEFESIFISMMYKQMDKAGFKSDLIKPGLSEDVFKDMYYDEIAKKAALKEDIGIAESMYQQLKNK
ncbi:MAG: rod-binding protein [Bacillota bacterium]